MDRCAVPVNDHNYMWKESGLRLSEQLVSRPVLLHPLRNNEPEKQCEFTSYKVIATMRYLFKNEVCSVLKSF